jgi:hypothetical protein
VSGANIDSFLDLIEAEFGDPENFLRAGFYLQRNSPESRDLKITRLEKKFSW